MSNKLFTLVDRSVSRIGPLNTLVDNMLNWFTPKMAASAAGCGGLRWASNCTDMGAWFDFHCPNGLRYTEYRCTQWYYQYGKKYGNCVVVGSSCSYPTPDYGFCDRTCS